MAKKPRKKRNFIYYDKSKVGKEYTTFSRGMAARPFLYPALKENEGKIIGDIAKAIKEALS